MDAKVDAGCAAPASERSGGESPHEFAASTVASQEVDRVQNGHCGCVSASSEISAGESAYDLAASDNNVNNLHSELEFEWYLLFGTLDVHSCIAKCLRPKRIHEM